VDLSSLLSSLLFFCLVFSSPLLLFSSLLFSSLLFSSLLFSSLLFSSLLFSSASLLLYLCVAFCAWRTVPLFRTRHATQPGPYFDSQQATADSALRGRDECHRPDLCPVKFLSALSLSQAHFCCLSILILLSTLFLCSFLLLSFFYFDPPLSLLSLVSLFPLSFCLSPLPVVCLDSALHLFS
jgi:hypothetical protein